MPRRLRVRTQPWLRHAGTPYRAGRTGAVPRPPPDLHWGGRLTRKSSGAWGEDLALRYLTRRGYSLVERNEGILVFVEVKLRRSTRFGDPLEAVTARKQATIRALAEQYLADNQPDFDIVRFDVVGILATHTRTRIEHIEDAF